MTLNKMGNFSFNHTDQQDDLYHVQSALQIKQDFDSRANELKTILNALVDSLTAQTAAGDLGAATISGLTGDTIQELLQALKNLADGKANSSDVYTVTQLSSVASGTSGASKIKATPIATSPNTVQGILEWLKNQMDSLVLGQISDGSISIQKLSFDVATQSELDAVKSSVSDGKTLVKNAIAGKGGTVLDADGDGFPTHQELANGVNTIQTSVAISGTAVNADVLTGKTYYNTDATAKQTGSMANRGAMTITPGTTNQIIPDGYHNGSGVVNGDVNLIAANILSGKSIFGVAGSVVKSLVLSAGTNQQSSPTTQKTTGNPSVYTKFKEVTVNYAGTIRASFDLSVTDTTNQINGKIYVNGIARGLERQKWTTGFTTYTEDFTVNVGDKVQLYAYTNNNNGITYLSNFKILTTELPVTTVNMD